MPAIYEKRTYDVTVGQMPEVIRLYQESGYPAMQAGGFDRNLVGYFISDTGALHQLVHLWRFDSDEARRAFWTRLAADAGFAPFVARLRPLLLRQEVQLLLSAPWGPAP
ncbi:MAG TPA: NIPSNAP family protein [Burkholderiaceae bacterium]|nr:NIPSNAP family protein [Burkholderiaceae bacterium]